MLDKLSIEAFNNGEHLFNARPIVYIRRMADSATLLFFVEPSDLDAKLPREGESCDVIFPGFGKNLATRVDNPCSLWHIRDDFWEKCLAFEINLQNKRRIMQTFPNLNLTARNMKIPAPSELRCFRVAFELRVSTSTRDAELTALHVLNEGRKGIENGLSQWQIDAYRYFVRFGSPTGYMRLFQRFPHMMDPVLNPEATLPRLVQLFESLNEQQRQAYINLLEKIPNGICIIHGCPGAGKTHFNLMVAAALQSRDEIVHSGSESPSPWNNKVLYLLDINRPLNDTANKMARLYDELGLTKRCRIDGTRTSRVALRMFCWSYEKTTASRNRLQAQREELNHRIAQLRGHEGLPNGDSEEQTGGNPVEPTTAFTQSPLSQYRHRAEVDNSERLAIHRFAPAFRRAEHNFMSRVIQPEDHIAPSLDDAAWALYQRCKDTKYAQLRTIRRHINLVRSTDLEDVENAELETLYQDTLLDADIVFTTPVCAAKFSSAMFSPAVIIFDEAPHARELSTLIALAHFNPAAWIFSGDVRQTKPFVRSFGGDTCRNEYVHQLRVSMMERAYYMKPDEPSLNINHRARGDLQRLASSLFYRGKMVPAIDPQRPGAIPPSTAHLRNNYIMPMKTGDGKIVSRLLVKLKEPGPVREVDHRSWYHPGHLKWAMELVLKLLKDPGFRQTNGVERGTILIMSPYKQAFIQYGKAIRELKIRNPRFKDRVVEARTVDTAQGHEADVVILDFVRDHPTSHLNNPNRLCVALTRARQAEFILMHKSLVNVLEYRSSYLRDMVTFCKKSGEFIDGPAPLIDVNMAGNDDRANNGGSAARDPTRIGAGVRRSS
ncbi:hypothetical protein N8I77_002980 [Diaporthe amygdali]|uniref:Uncharacterized protein n=1 Tax=Phomopsis amygdali TaxID=1214568 RepID=A0AAD9SIA8_PHOAM|nr:hypothetical protein N8I77_002980 [Diaporthe amygdali]